MREYIPAVFTTPLSRGRCDIYFGLSIYFIRSMGVANKYVFSNSVLISTDIFIGMQNRARYSGRIKGVINMREYFRFTAFISIRCWQPHLRIDRIPRKTRSGT